MVAVEAGYTASEKGNYLIYLTVKSSHIACSSNNDVVALK
jgi:hypothetical protein